MIQKAIELVESKYKNKVKTITQTKDPYSYDIGNEVIIHYDYKFQLEDDNTIFVHITEIQTKGKNPNKYKTIKIIFDSEIHTFESN